MKLETRAAFISIGLLVYGLDLNHAQGAIGTNAFSKGTGQWVCDVQRIVAMEFKRIYHFNSDGTFLMEYLMNFKNEPFSNAQIIGTYDFDSRTKKLRILSRYSTVNSRDSAVRNETLTAPDNEENFEVGFYDGETSASLRWLPQGNEKTEVRFCKRR